MTVPNDPAAPETPATPDAGLPGKQGYDPHGVEERWYRFWEEKGLFHADETSTGSPYCIVIPPPNVTGSLHMGHALNNTLQDILIRWHRMRGDSSLWMPGTDHAGIATQNVVERKLRQEGLTREDLGREAFIERVWQWKRESGGTIIRQLKTLGASCDWERERFTLDPGLSNAVREVFCRLYDAGLIYRGNYIINWCPRCRTALSDLEVEHQERDGKLWHIRYPLVSGTGEVVVATTRPETMLGDTALAVHPEDERYRALVGQRVLLPVMGREIPIIADDYVDREFGTGVVKVTPAHDPKDFECGLRHNLPQIKVIADDGRMLGKRGRLRRGGPVHLPQEPGQATGAGGAARQGRGAPARRGAVLSLPDGGGALALPAVVREDGPPGRAGHPGGGDGAHPDHPRAMGEDLLRVDAEYPGLVYLAADLVGAPDSGLVLRSLRRDDRLAHDPAGLPAMRRNAAPGDRRPGHLVQLGPLAVLHAGMAREDQGPRRLLPDRLPRHRVRHPLLLGGPDDHARAALHGGRALPGRGDPRPDPGRAGRQDVEDPGQRRRSAARHQRRHAGRGSWPAPRRAAPPRRRWRVSRGSTRMASRDSAPTRCGSPWPPWRDRGAM